MTPEVQLAIINNLPTILTAIVSFIGAIGALLGYQKSHSNSKDLRETKEKLDDNTCKTEEVGKAVNGRMSAFIVEMERKNAETLAEAVKAAKAEVEKIALEQIAELRGKLAQATADQALKNMADKISHQE